MANISAELAAIMAAVYGEEVRGSIHDAIDKINTASEKAISSGTAFNVNDPATGYPSGSLYLNTSIQKLLRSNGTTWQDGGSIKGDNGVGISSIVKTGTVGLVDTYTITYTDGTTLTFNVTNGQNGADGDDGKGITSIAKTSTSGLVDTYTITYTDSTTSTFEITNGANGSDGADGQNGNVWGTGTALSGTGTRLTGYPGVVGDCYLNTESNNVYQCITAGTASTAEWNYITNIKGQSGSGTGDMQSSVYAFSAIAAGYNNVVDSALTLKGLTAEINELNALDGVTGNVQSQLNAKATTTQLSDGLSTKVSNPAASVEEGKVLTSNGDGTARWSTPQAGSSSLHNLTDVNDAGKANDSVLKFNGTAWVPDNNIVPKTNKIPAGNGTNGQVLTSHGDGTASWEDPATGGHTMVEQGTDKGITNLEAITAATDNKVVNAYTVRAYANSFKYKFISTINAGHNSIGEPIEDKSTWSSATETTAGWMFSGEYEQAVRDLLIGLDLNESANLDWRFDPVAAKTGLSVVRWQFDTTTGMMCFVFNQNVEVATDFCVDLELLRKWDDLV